MSHGVLLGVAWAVLGYFVLANAFQTLLLAGASAELIRHGRTVWNARTQRLLASAATPRVSVLAPAFNEAATVADSVRALLTLSYPNLEVVVVNDGSGDGTLRVLKAEFHLRPVRPVFRRHVETQPVLGVYRSRRHHGLVVVDKANGGKADALNAGLNVAAGELVCAIDADTLIEPDALLRIVRPFLARDDTVAAGATIRVVNGSLVRHGRVVDARAPRRPLPGVQTVEYLRSFLFGRLGWNRLGGNLIVSGAFGMFRRDAMLAAGGYRQDSVGEDMELVVRLRRVGVESGQPSRVVFVPDPIAWTEVPESARVLARQRDRWQRGLADVLWRHRRLMLNPRSGSLGLVAVPYYVLVELLGPVLEALGLLGLAGALAVRAADLTFAVLFFLVLYGWGLLLSVWGLLLHQMSADEPFRARDLPVLLGWCLLESVGYRQLTMIWRIRGLWRFLRRRTEWGAMVRVGFESAPPRS